MTEHPATRSHDDWRSSSLLRAIRKTFPPRGRRTDRRTLTYQDERAHRATTDRHGRKPSFYADILRCKLSIAIFCLPTMVKFSKTPAANAFFSHHLCNFSENYQKFKFFDRKWFFLNNTSVLSFENGNWQGTSRLAFDRSSEWLPELNVRFVSPFYRLHNFHIAILIVAISRSENATWLDKGNINVVHECMRPNFSSVNLNPTVQVASYTESWFVLSLTGPLRTDRDQRTMIRSWW